MYSAEKLIFVFEKGRLKKLKLKPPKGLRCKRKKGTLGKRIKLI